MPRKPRTNRMDRADFALVTGHLQHYACFGCRKAFKQPFSADLPERACPQCRQPMTIMGTDFKAPRQDDVRQWQKVAVLARAGIRFFPSSPDGLPGQRPDTLAEVPAFLRRIYPAARALAPHEGRLLAQGEAPHQRFFS